MMIIYVNKKSYNINNTINKRNYINMKRNKFNKNKLLLNKKTMTNKNYLNKNN